MTNAKIISEIAKELKGRVDPERPNTVHVWDKGKLSSFVFTKHKETTLWPTDSDFPTTRHWKVYQYPSHATHTIGAFHSPKEIAEKLLKLQCG